MDKDFSSSNRLDSLIQDFNLQAFLICEKVIQSSNEIFSLINIFERVYLEKFPTEYSFHAYANFYIKPGDYSLKIDMELPDGEVVNYLDYSGSISFGVVNVNTPIRHLFDQAGIYYLKFSINSELLKSHKLEVFPKSEIGD